jgi:phosphoglycerate dehydrogenase-like enzyme
MKVVFLGRLSKDAIAARMKKVPGADVVVADTVAQLVEALPGADALITPDCLGDEARKIVEALRGPGKTVRWLQFVSAGQEGLTAAGVLSLPPSLTITQQGGAVAPSVAEHAMAMLLALVRRIHESSANTAKHFWDPTLTQRTTALEGRVLAIVGLGNVGRQIARRARAFEMPILAVTVPPDPDPLADEVHPLSSLQNVLSRADAIVVAIALTKNTYHLIGAKEFAVCKPGAFFVNVARGGVVDPVALRDALNQGKIAGAGIDVTEPEPLPPDDPLWNCPNVIISPHIAGGGSPKSRIRLAEIIGDNLERFVTGKPLAHVLER